MVETEPQVTELAGELHRVLSKVFAVLRRGDTSRLPATAGDLTLAQLSILLTLLDQGPIRMTELAAHERVRTPTTTVAIRRLEKLGLVKRSRDPSDLRAVLVDITPRGLAQHRESLAARQAQLVDQDGERERAVVRAQHLGRDHQGGAERGPAEPSGQRGPTA